MAEETIQKLNIVIQVDWDKKKFELVSADLGKVSQKIEETGKKSQKSSIDLNKLAKAFGLGAIAGFGLYEALKETVDILKEGIKQAVENEIVLSKLSFRLSTLGEKNIPRVIESLNKWTEGLVKITYFTQTELTAALDELIKYTGDIQSAQKLLISAIQLSTAEHKNLSEVVHELGAAIAMPEYGLRRLRKEYGSLVGDAKNVTEAIENITKNLEKQGAQALTYAQRWRKIQATVSEALEQIGKVILSGLNNVILPFFEDIFNLGETLSRAAHFWASRVTWVFIAIAKGIKAANEYVWQADKIFEKSIQKTVKGIKDFAKEFEKTQVKVRKDLEREAEEKKKIEDKLTDYINKKRAETTEFALQLLEKEVEEYRKAGIKKELIEEYYSLRKQEILEKEKEATKQDLEEMASYYEEYAKDIEAAFEKQWSEVRETWGSVLDGIVSATKEGLVEMIDQGNIAAESFEQIWERIKKAFINALTSMVAEYVAKMAIISGISMFTGIPMGAVASGIGWKIPGLQEGGIVKKPTVALLGEKGPEAVIPLNRTKEILPTINLQVNAFDLRSISRIQLESFIRQLKPILNKELRR